MRTKEEMLEKLPTDLNELEKYDGWNNLEARVRVVTLETLIDIRNVLADDNIYIEEMAKNLESIAGKYLRSNK